MPPKPKISAWKNTFNEYKDKAFKSLQLIGLRKMERKRGTWNHFQVHKHDEALAGFEAISRRYQLLDSHVLQVWFCSKIYGRN